MPLWKPYKSIHSYNKTQYDARPQFELQFAQGFQAITHAITANFPLIQNKSGIAFDGHANHSRTVFRGSKRSTAQPRDACRNKADFLQTRCFGNFFSYAQMTVMDGIEGAAED